MNPSPDHAAPNRRKKRWLVVAIAVVGAVVAGGVAFLARNAASKEGDAKKPQPPLEFATSEVVHLSPQSLGQDLSVTGTLDAVQKVTLRAKVSAEVRALPVREGDRVSAGQLVAQIDTADADARLAERVGTLESARANLALSEKNRATNRNLLAQGFISQNAYDAIESNYQANVGQVQAADANVAIARNAVRDARVVAPIAGIVSKRHVQPGEKVAFDAALVSIVDLRTLEMQAMVPADEVPLVRLGAAASLRVDGFRDRTFKGRVERIAPATEPGTRAVLVLISVANPDEALKAGMFAAGAVAIERTVPVPTLPIDAVRSAGGDSHVWVIADGKLQRRSVRVGRRDEAARRVEIVTGLRPDDVVLAARFDNLREGAQALVSNAPGGAPAVAAPEPATAAQPRTEVQADTTVKSS